jgi:hypothetical protein
MGLTRPTFAQIRGASSAVDTVSDSTSVLSQQISVLSSRVADNSAQMISADNAISNAVSVVSAQLASVDTKLSNAVSVVSAAAASIESHVNTVSNAVSVVSAQLASVDTKLSNAISALSNAISSTYAQKSGATFTGNVVVSATLSVVGDATFKGAVNIAATGGDEGGQIDLALATTNTTLNGGVVIDIYQNKIRFFEKTGTSRGAYIDFTSAGSGIGTNLLAGGGGGGTTSVTSANFVSVATALSNAISVVSAQVATNSAQMTSANNAISNAVSVVSAAQLSTWNAVSNEISVRAAASADLKSAINVVSNAVSVVSAAQLSTWNAVSNEISVRGAASADLKSAINVVSNAVSVVSAQVATNSAQMTSANNAISNAVSIVSAAQLSTWNKVSAILTSSQTFSGSTYGFSNTLQRNSRNVVTNYTGVSAPSTPLVGDEWYYTTSDILYKYIYDGTNYAWVDLTSPLYNTATAATANTIALRDSGGNLTATNFLGVASSAKYADLAEIYTSDYNYTAGTVVVLDGPAEITQSTHSHDTRIAGVISDKPAYLMNSEAKGLPVALMGRVPCQVTGTVTKGDRLVASYKPGHAMSMNPNLYEPGCIIGKALEDFTGESGTIEIMVGRT